jgi:exosortase
LNIPARYHADESATGVTNGSAAAPVQWAPIALALVTLEALVLYAPTFVWLFDRWTMSVWHNAHGLFVPPLVVWIAHAELKRRPDLPIRPSPWGFALLVPSLLIHALDAGLNTQLVAAASIVVALPGFALLFLGVARTRVILFPLLFSAFALPIPLGLTESAHLVLRQVSAHATAWLLPLAGVRVYLEGTTLHLPSADLLVGDACSGFSTLYAAMAVACLTAYSTASNFRRALVILAVAPVAIAANIARVLFLVLLVAWRGEAVLATPLHPMSGLLTFAIALPVIFWLGGPAGRKADH